MARQLWFLRHGEAIPHGAKDDSDRELTPRGERQAEAAGQALAKLSLEFDRCYTSPKVRALTTARLACERLGTEVEEVGSMTAGFDVDDLRELLHAHDDDARLLFVGHEPDFSQIVHDLTGARLDLKKGGVAAVRVDGATVELLALLRPRELESLAGSGSDE
jgi:phosphohistidine phosphatase